MVSLNRLIHGPPEYLDQPPAIHYRSFRFASYIVDWSITIILLGLTSYFTDKPGFQRQFSFNDIDIQHTYAVHERVPFTFAILYAGVIPAAIILFIGVFWRRSFWDVHHGILGLLLSIAMSTVVTDVIKITIGRPRPDFLDRCQPIAGAVNAIPYGLATIASCTIQSGSIINDGFKSFPSGHSSFSFAGLGFLSFYLAGKMGLFDKNGYVLKAWIGIIPLIGASLIAITRVMDYRHRGSDIIAGGLLGFLMAFFSYYLYYPSLYSPYSHIPHSPRTPTSASKLESLPTSDSGIPLQNSFQSGGVGLAPNNLGRDHYSSVRADERV